jgi:4'-phosphopantetheinyl transferase EntD
MSTEQPEEARQSSRPTKSFRPARQASHKMATVWRHQEKVAARTVARLLHAAHDGVNRATRRKGMERKPMKSNA